MKTKSIIVLVILFAFATILILYTYSVEEKGSNNSSPNVSTNNHNKSSLTNYKEVEDYIKEQKQCDFEIVEMGMYEQDNNENNGLEPIEWMVIYEDDERQLLLSRYILDKVVVSYDKYESWENTKGYKWLNDTFYNMAFSEEEKEKIILSHIDDEINGNIIDGELYLQTSYDAYLFYLSADEVNNYFLNSEGNFKKGFAAYKTPYCNAVSPYKINDKAVQKEVDELVLKGVLVSDWWPLRTPCLVTYEYVDDVATNPHINFSYVFKIGNEPFGDKFSYSIKENFIDYCKWNQRPAMWVNK